MKTFRYTEDSEFLKMSYQDFISWRIGVCIMAIAQDRFRTEFETSMIMMIDWQLVNNSKIISMTRGK